MPSSSLDWSSPRIRDLPTAERPRERLLACGPQALSTAELVAVVLRSGAPGASALDVASRLLARFGLAGLGGATLEELAAEPGCGPATVAILRASFELGRRAATEQAPARPRVCTPADVASLLAPEMAMLEQEHLRVVLLNTRHHVMGVHEVYKGSVSASLVRVAEVFREPVRRNCPAIVVAHNHPSGDPSPSPEDVRITRHLVSGGRTLDIDVLDHVIIGRSRWVSLRERGLGFDARGPPTARWGPRYNVGRLTERPVIFAEYEGRSTTPPDPLVPPDAAPEPESRVGHPAAPMRAPDEPIALVAERGVSVRGPFLGFWETFGQSLCGLPLTDEILVNGVRSQVFDNLVLEEHAPGHVRPAACGAAWLAATTRQAAANGLAPAAAPAPTIDLVGQLPTANDTAYPSRTLADIRYLVLHHTGAPIEVGPRQIADEHVHALGWPGIGYHYVIGADGTAWRTQDLATISHHARQFNPVAVGIALVGDLSRTAPPPEQIDGAARLVAELANRLGLPLEAVRGHGEMVPTACPGDAFLGDWKPRLLEAVERARRGAHAIPMAPLGP